MVRSSFGGVHGVEHLGGIDVIGEAGHDVSFSPQDYNVRHPENAELIGDQALVDEVLEYTHTSLCALIERICQKDVIFELDALGHTLPAKI